MLSWSISFLPEISNPFRLTLADVTTTVNGFQDAIVFNGLVEPTSLQFASDGRVFVAEKSGIIKIFDSLLATTPTVFADLRTKVHNFGNRGLPPYSMSWNTTTTSTGQHTLTAVARDAAGNQTTSAAVKVKVNRRK